jgi:endoglucanase
VSWGCWLHGCRVSRRPSPRSNKTYPAYRAAGMGSLLRALRSTGARQPVLLGGLAFAKDLSRWLHYRPKDPARQLVASLHTYGPENALHAAVCLTQCRREVAGIARRYPVVAGEIGEYDCAHAYIDDIMSWADGHGISYLGWTWDAVSPRGWQCGSGPALIENYNGTPTAFGVGLRDHLRAR